MDESTQQPTTGLDNTDGQKETPFMTFELNNPPIIESWIRATFDVPPESPEWDWESATPFLDSIGEEFNLPVREVMQIPEPIVERLDDEGLPETIELRAKPGLLRVRTESRDRVVQVGQAEVLVSQMRDEVGSYPGFTPLRDLFMTVQERFRRAMSVGSLSGLEVHYVDMIHLLVPGEFDLRDFFEGAPELPPEPFGLSFTAEWAMKLLTPEPDCTDVAELSVQSMPPEDGRLPFRLDWHRWCRDVADDSESIASRLDMAHTYLKDCFRAVCKPAVWQSFDPVE